MSSCEVGWRDFFLGGPGGCLVVDGAGLEASVQDADEPVGELAEGGGVLCGAGAFGVVEGPGAGRGGQGGEGLGHQRVGEPVVADEPGGDDLLLSRRAGDRGGGGVVLAGLAAGVAVRVVAELAEDPGAEDGSQAGLGQVDLSVRAAAKIRLHLPLQGLYLLIQGGDHRDQGPHGDSVGGGDSLRLAQLLAAQRRQDRRRLVRDVPAVSALERGADLRAGQPRGPGRVRGLAQQLQRAGGVQVLEGLQRGGEVLAQLVPQPLPLPGPLPDQRLVRAGQHLDASAPALSPATARSWWESVRTMSVSMCASPLSLLAPDTPCRSRYLDACKGFTAYTTYPAAASAATHGPRSVSVPISTSASSVSSPRCSPISSCSRAIPATPSGSRRFASTFPASFITSTS